MTENRISASMTLWDSNADLPKHLGLVYLWNGYIEEGSTHSLLSYAEAHGDRLRSKYLNWIHELGESRIDNKSLIEHLAFEEGLSYWWMTLFVEKSPYKSPITDAIRLMALEEVVVHEKPEKVHLISANRSLHEAVKGLCQSLVVDYEWESLPIDRCRSIGIKYVYRALPQFVQGLITLARYVWKHWSLRRAESSGWFGGDKAIFFCSYFFNIAPDLAEKGHFHSRYWEGLHRLMSDMGLRGNWMQLYDFHNPEPDLSVAMKWIQGFNIDCQKEGFHTFLDVYLSWSIVLRVLKRWIKLNIINRRFSGIKRAFRPQGSHISLWPCMRGDWHASLGGSVAISNLLWIELFDKALHELPHQNKGFYLCENQAWERALVHAWRKHGHGCLVAVPHSTVSFWDLRHFSDLRSIQSTQTYSMPKPDMIALNGKVAVDAYLTTAYPKGAIVESEALRYQYLNDFSAEHRSRKRNNNIIKVLILGDYMPLCTNKMLQLLEAMTSNTSTLTATYTLKPHPAYLIEKGAYPSLDLKVIREPLGDILHDFDIAYASSMTSAAVDAYLAGLPVVVMLDEMKLNFSPLRGQLNVDFVSTAEELLEAIQSPGQNCEAKPNCDDFFFLDQDLPRWKRLLE